MKKNILWMLLSFLLVAALVLASCGPAVPGEQEEEEEEPAVGVPQYGGTLTVRHHDDTTPIIADVTLPAMQPTMAHIGPVLEYLVRVDYEELGPRGTGEWPTTFVVCPEPVMTGYLAESWEVYEDKLVFHIRPGVYWQAEGKEHVMESRELTVDDIVFSFTRVLDTKIALIKWTEDGGWIDSVYAEDNTVVFELSKFSSQWPYVLSSGWMNAVYAPEVVEAGADDWDNLVGTGPFMFEERVEGSHMKYVRNPDYWATTTINGTEYEIPFVDELIYTAIPDFSTRLAALQTGKIDVYYLMSSKYEPTLAQTNPELLKYSTIADGGYLIALRTDLEPLNNKEVRRALMIALDLPAINRAIQFGGPGDYYSSPVSSVVRDTHVPLEELPPETRMLWDFNPELAKQMLADAGYPEGFTLTACGTGEAEYMVAAKGYWDAIGVELDIEIVDWGVMGGMFWAGQATDYDYQVGDRGMGQADALDGMQQYLTGHAWNFTQYDNPYFTERWWEAVGTVDEAARNAIIKELTVIALDSVAYIPIGSGRNLQYWWPWVENYYGEAFTSDRTCGIVEAGIWIDQDLKESMGY